VRRADVSDEFLESPAVDGHQPDEDAHLLVLLP
jgi:hypothetical protein